MKPDKRALLATAATAALCLIGGGGMLSDGIYAHWPVVSVLGGVLIGFGLGVALVLGAYFLGLTRPRR